MRSWPFSKSMSEWEAASRTDATLPVSLYLHVPFCVSRCAYCAFHSAPLPPDGDVRARFVEAVGHAARYWAALGLLDDVSSVYVGGGTPTALGDALCGALRALLGPAVVAPTAEVTIETNPETTTRELVGRVRSEGVNRISVGVQSLDEAVLRALGRRHSPAQAAEAVGYAKDAAASVSVDLMCGAPAQSLTSWEATLKGVIRLGVDHVSVYPLSVEEGTPLAMAVRERGTATPDDEATAEMMELAEGLLAASGLRRYEVASYARPGHECEHNVGYWTGRPYIGIGPSAASMLPVQGRVSEAVRCGDAARVRFTSPADTDAFLQRPAGPPIEVECLTHAEAAAEDVMLGLRRTAGISEALVAGPGTRQALERLTEAGLVERVDGRWRTTRSGWLLGNEVFEAVWNSRSRNEG